MTKLVSVVAISGTIKVVVKSSISMRIARKIKRTILLSDDNIDNVINVRLIHCK